VDAVGKCHVSEMSGEAVRAQIIDHPCTEKPTGTDEFREFVSSRPEVAFTYCTKYVGTRSSLVGAGKRHDDTDRNRLGVDLGQGNSRHQSAETMCVDIDRYMGLDCRDVSQQPTERVSHRSHTSKGVRPLIVRRLERRRPPRVYRRNNPTRIAEPNDVRDHIPMVFEIECRHCSGSGARTIEPIDHQGDPPFWRRQHDNRFRAAITIAERLNKVTQGNRYQFWVGIVNKAENVDTQNLQPSPKCCAEKAILGRSGTPHFKKVESLGALDQVMKLLCSFGIAAFDKFNPDDSHTQQRCRVDIDLIHPRPKMKALSGNGHLLAGLYPVTSLNKQHPDEGVTGFQSSTMVDRNVQRPRHWSCENHRAWAGCGNRVTNRGVIFDSSIAGPVGTIRQAERVKHRG
jgi:hypothetical protein